MARRVLLRLPVRLTAPGPPDWQRARVLVAADARPGPVVVLPWSSYRAFPWNRERVSLDPAPRVVLESRFGLASLGRTAKDARIVEELYEHTIDVILRAEAIERYEALPLQDIFDVEYWDL